MNPLLIEFNNKSFKSQLPEKCGTTCKCCGNTEGEMIYCHVVPLNVGGTNRFTNIVPICHKCIKAYVEGYGY